MGQDAPPADAAEVPEDELFEAPERGSADELQIGRASCRERV